MIRRRLRTLALVGVGTFATLLLAGCGGSPSKPGSNTDAATYNLQLGVAYLQQGNLAVAKEKLERAYQQNPRDAEVHGALALLYSRGALVSVHFYIATGLGIGVAMMLMAALMGLVFLSSGTGHDESIADPLEDERD